MWPNQYDELLSETPQICSAAATKPRSLQLLFIYLSPFQFSEGRRGGILMPQTISAKAWVARFLMWSLERREVEMKGVKGGQGLQGGEGQGAKRRKYIGWDVKKWRWLRRKGVEGNSWSVKPAGCFSGKRHGLDTSLGFTVNDWSVRPWFHFVSIATVIHKMF